MVPERGRSSLSWRSGLIWLWRNVGPGLAISAILLMLLALAGEFYLRYRAQAFVPSVPLRFDPQVGTLFQPGAEIVTSNNLEYRTRQRANSLGFLDREPAPPQPGRCHLALIGDSFVEAQQVEIEQKAQILLETLAAERAPGLKLTTAGFGISDTGQFGQLLYYDIFARSQSPKIVVLVFVKNDFADNSALLQSIMRGIDPEHMPRPYGRRGSNGEFELQPIDPDWDKHLLLPKFDGGSPGAVRTWLLQRSKIYHWIEESAWRAKLLIGRWIYGPSAVAHGSERIAHNAGILARDPHYARALEGWDVRAHPALDEVFFERDLPPVFREALALTGFALDEFVARARRDGFQLLILATQTMVREGSTLSLDRLKELADARGIPVIDLHRFIEAQGGRIADARWLYDGHWSVQGHLWAAEALLDHLMRNPGLCR